MKRISYCVFVSILALGAQVAWAANESATIDEADGDRVEILAGSPSAEDQMRASAPKEVRKVQTIPEFLGVAGVDPFPSRGGNVDD